MSREASLTGEHRYALRRKSSAGQQRMQAEEHCRITEVAEERVAVEGQARDIAIEETRQGLRIETRHRGPGAQVGDQEELQTAEKAGQADPSGRFRGGEPTA